MARKDRKKKVIEDQVEEDQTESEEVDEEEQVDTGDAVVKANTRQVDEEEQVDTGDAVVKANTRQVDEEEEEDIDRKDTVTMEAPENSSGFTHGRHTIRVKKGEAEVPLQLKHVALIHGFKSKK